jgi:hypothetical protein
MLCMPVLDECTLMFFFIRKEIVKNFICLSQKNQFYPQGLFIETFFLIQIFYLFSKPVRRSIRTTINRITFSFCFSPLFSSKFITKSRTFLNLSFCRHFFSQFFLLFFLNLQTKRLTALDTHQPGDGAGLHTTMPLLMLESTKRDSPNNNQSFFVTKLGQYRIFNYNSNLI